MYAETQGGRGSLTYGALPRTSTVSVVTPAISIYEVCVEAESAGEREGELLAGRGFGTDCPDVVGHVVGGEGERIAGPEFGRLRRVRYPEAVPSRTSQLRRCSTSS